MSSTLPEHLHRELSRMTATSLCVAYSGGPDSSALLHALATLDLAPEWSLRAIHVNHHLNPDSDAWAEHCARLCQTLAVPLDVLDVQVVDDGHGLEAAARTARYAAIAPLLGADEHLATAHHRDDQAETVLLKLLRGAGPQGLGGMRPRRPLGAGVLWRPLLELPRTALQDYARNHALECIDDPSNRELQLARGFLRGEILPRLHRHWPQAEQTLGHVARLSADAADFINQKAAHALTTLQRTVDGSLDAPAWLRLHLALRGVVLERWLHQRGLSAPTHAQQQELERQVKHAAPGRIPEITWPGVRVRCWRQRLYAHAGDSLPPKHWNTHWNGHELDLPGGGLVRLEPESAVKPSAALEVRLGQTGVHFKPHGDRHTRALRDLFQQAALPPWLRRACPLIHASDGTLLAVADLWLTEAGAKYFHNAGVHVHWQRPQ